jgi:hypothetical protein
MNNLQVSDNFYNSTSVKAVNLAIINNMPNVLKAVNINLKKDNCKPISKLSVEYFFDILKVINDTAEKNGVDLQSGKSFGNNQKSKIYKEA